MRLLIFTQTVNRDDPTLGFFHNWLRELAKHFEQVTVFALRTGKQDLPANVTVFPLRPTGTATKLRTALRVLRLAWLHRREYDAVFVHMNQEYLLVAGWLFWLLGKRVYMWRNHYAGSFRTSIAAFFCDKVFYTSKSSYTARFRKSVQMPVGVDVDSHYLEGRIERKPHSILFLGRFDASKRPDLVVEALGKLYKEGIKFTATFVGGPKDVNSTFPKEVAARANELGIWSFVRFVGPVANNDKYDYYRSHDIYVNCGKTGMLDKTLFESIACGCLPIFSSEDLAGIIGSEFLFKDGNLDGLTAHFKKALALSEGERTVRVEEYAKKAIDVNALPVLAKRLFEEMG